MASKIVYIVTGIFVLFLIVASVLSIYKEGLNMIPGLAPNVYKQNTPVPLFVNKVTSVNSPIPYRYHDLPVCKPNDIMYKTESLGEVVTGNRIESSVYEIKFLENSRVCKHICQVKLQDKRQIEDYQELIKEEYLAQWQLDGLPASTRIEDTYGKVKYETGFPLGYKEKDPNGKYVVYNHLNITVHYNPHESSDGTVTPGEYNVVLFEVNVHSNGGTCNGGGPLYLSEDTKEINYSYSVNFQQSSTKWIDRWHEYLALQGEGQIHWFSIINSLMIVFFLSGMIAMILARTVRRDLIKYTEEDNDEVEETGWKLLNGDVFRPPSHKGTLAVLVGSGVQVFFMCTVTIIFAVLGFVSPANQGSITTAVLVLYVWMGVAAGYTSSRLYIIFEGEPETRTRNTLLTALFFPGMLFGIAFFLNFFLWYKHSSGAFPFTTLLAIMALWFCISVPLCFLGASLAYRKDPPKHPGNVNHIPKTIPAYKWHMHPVATVLMGGILPFGAVFIELFFIMSSIWLHRYYFLFGFLFLVFLILIITCAEISIVMCYFQLCAEDWKWWWRSFLTPATSAFYMFGYAIFYYSTRLHVDGFVASILYFGYTLILCLFFFVLTGTIGFYSCYWFVKRIYGAIHQD